MKKSSILVFAAFVLATASALAQSPPLTAGGGYSTAPDLLAFDAAMRADKLLSPAWTDWYFSDKEKAPVAGAPARKHSGAGGFAGGTAGVNAVIETDLDTGYSIVVLSNDDPPSAEAVAKKIRQWLGLK